MNATKPAVRHKTFTYQTRLEWLENRAGSLTATDKPALRISSPPEFKGESGTWSPEDLFVAAVSACTMTTFNTFAMHKKLPVISYSCEAEGVLEFADGGYRFTRVHLRPVIGISSEEHVAATRQVMEDAHNACLVSNSVTTAVTLDTTINVQGQAGA